MSIHQLINAVIIGFFAMTLVVSARERGRCARAAYADQGNATQAREHLEKALQSDGYFQGREHAEEMLAALKAKPTEEPS